MHSFLLQNQQNALLEEGTQNFFLKEIYDVKFGNIYSEVAQSCLTPSNPMNRSPPGSSVHGIFQARVLECI